MDINEFNTRVGKKIFNLRKQKKMSRVELGKMVGLHETTIKKYEDGNIKRLGADKLKEFANALDTDIAYLMDWTSSKDLERHEPNAFKHMIPVIGKIPAGEPNWAEQYAEGFDIIDDPSVDYALRVHGDSMINAGIFNGSIVYVEQNAVYNNGDVVIALINDSDATVKRFYKYDGKIILRPENPTMKDLVCDPETIEILGKVKFVKTML